MAGADVPVHRGVDDARLGLLVDDLPDDGDVSQVEGAVEHPDLEGHDGLEPLAPGLEVDVQGGVAVEEVVPATALEDVTALAAEDDVVRRVVGQERTGVAWHRSPTEQVTEADNAVQALLGELVALAGDLRRVAREAVAPEDVVAVPAGQALHVQEARTHELHVRRREHCDPEVGIRDERVVLVRDPVEAEHAAVPVDTVVGHDVVAALGVVVVVAGAADEDVGPAVRVVLEGERVVALHEVGTVVALQPVVTLVAGQDVTGGAAADEVVAGSREGLGGVLVVEDEVDAGTTEQQVQPGTRVDRVVAVATVDDVVAEQVGDHVVAVATDEDVVALAAFEVVGTVVAPDGVVADTAPDAVVGGGAVDDHVVLAVEAVPAVDDGQVGGGGVAVAPRGRVTDVERPGRVGEDVVVQPGRVRVAERELGERVPLELLDEVHAGGAEQVVEAVAVLEVLHLGLEHRVERGAEHATEVHAAFGEAADPEVDVVDAGVRRGCGHEGRVSRQDLRSRALRVHGGGVPDRLVVAVRGDEVDHRGTVLQAQPELLPVGVRLEGRIQGLVVEVAPDCLQRGRAGVPGAGDVERREVQRQPEELVPEGGVHELVDAVAGLPGHAHEDGRGTLIRGHRAVVGERRRIQEGVEQGEALGAEAHPVDVTGEHGVAEPVHDVRELGADRRVDVTVVQRLVEGAGVDVRRDGADELLEHEVLVLHLGDEPGGLEQAFAVIPAEVHLVPPGHEAGVGRLDVGQQVVDVVDEAVVLGVEDVVHGGQADVLVAAAVTGDVVLGEEAGVVGAVRGGVRRVGDVVQEGDAGAQGLGAVHRAGEVALDPAVVGHHELREPVGTGDEVAVGVGDEERDVVDVHVVQFDAEHRRGLLLDVRPGGEAGAGAAGGHGVAVEQLAGGHGLATHQFVLAQERLVGGVGGVGLVLVDVRRRLVDVLLDVVCGAEHAVRAGQVGGPAEGDEVVGAVVPVAGDVVRAVRVEEFVPGQDRDQNGAGAALANQVEAVIEELAEQGEPAGERRGEADVGRDVGDEDAVRRAGQRRRGIVGGVGDVGEVVEAVAVVVEGVGALDRGHHLDGRRVRHRLVCDQVGDDAGVGVDHEAALLRIRRVR